MAVNRYLRTSVSAATYLSLVSRARSSWSRRRSADNIGVILAELVPHPSLRMLVPQLRHSLAAKTTNLFHIFTPALLGAGPSGRTGLHD